MVHDCDSAFHKKLSPQWIPVSVDLEDSIVAPKCNGARLRTIAFIAFSWKMTASSNGAPLTLVPFAIVEGCAQTLPLTWCAWKLVPFFEIARNVSFSVRTS